MKTLMNLLLALLLLLCFENANGQLTSNENIVSLDLAHRLAASTLTESARHFPGMRFDAENKYHNQRFYWFEVTAQTPAGISPLLGYFAVNKTNGDVWDPVSCIKLKSELIRNFQRMMETNHPNQALSPSAGLAPCQP
jgi:hypothetical protein